MKSELELYVLENIFARFSSQFIKEVDKLKETLRGIGINLEKALPEPFRAGSKRSVRVFYSVDREQVMIIFNKDKDESFSFVPVSGNVVPTGIFNFTGDELESSISGLTLQSGEIQKVEIDYSIIFSYSVLLKRLDEIKDYARNFVRIHWDYYLYQHLKTKQDYINHLEGLKNQMEELFFDETVDELVIDKFLEVNSIILEQGLSLVKPMHQVILKNILGKYEHDLKPDLIAFDEREKMWAIVDYKKAKRNIIKNLNKVRTGFKAEVHSLEDQLRDYVEYFDEREQREYVEKEYRIRVEYPKAIGIIGNVHANEQTTFNRLKQDQPKWFDVVPYNYLYDNYCRYVELVYKLLSK